VNYNVDCKRQHLLKIAPLEYASCSLRLVSPEAARKSLTTRFLRVTMAAAGPRIPFLSTLHLHLLEIPAHNNPCVVVLKDISLRCVLLDILAV